MRAMRAEGFRGYRGRQYDNPSPVVAVELAAEPPSPQGLLADGEARIRFDSIRTIIGSIIGVNICLGNLKVGNGFEDQKKTN